MTSQSRTLVSLLFALTLLPPAIAADAGSAQTPSLPLGCWSLNANGTLGQLCIPSLNPDGTFVGKMMFPGYFNVVTGFWSSGVQQLNFLRLGVPTNPLSYQAYTGFLFPADAANPTGPQVLAGSFNVYGPGGGGTQTANFFGWTATHP